MPFIYALCDPDTSDVRYVGKADDIQRRYKEHVFRLSSPNTYRKSWIQSLRDQGKQPTIQVLEEVADLDWRERERWWIAEMKKRGAKLTNLTDGGDGVLNLVHSEAARLKMSASAKKRASSLEERARLRMLAKNQVVTDKKRQAMAQTHRGRKRSAETRQKQSAARMGMKFTPEHRANMSKVRMGRTAYNKGMPAPESIRKGVSLAQQKLTSEQLSEVRSLIAQGDMSQAAIARKFGVSPATITKIKQGYVYYTEKEN